MKLSGLQFEPLYLLAFPSDMHVPTGFAATPTIVGRVAHCRIWPDTLFTIKVVFPDPVTDRLVREPAVGVARPISAHESLGTGVDGVISTLT